VRRDKSKEGGDRRAAAAAAADGLRGSRNGDHSSERAAGEAGGECLLADRGWEELCPGWGSSYLLKGQHVDFLCLLRAAPGSDLPSACFRPKRMQLRSDSRSHCTSRSPRGGYPLRYSKNVRVGHFGAFKRED
jgi:hypothetical protein